MPKKTQHIEKTKGKPLPQWGDNLQEKFAEAMEKEGNFVFLDTRKQKLKHSPFRTLRGAVLRRFFYLLANWKSSVWVKTFWGDDILIPTRYSYSILEKGFFEGEELRLTGYILKTLTEGDIFVDGGAHFGWYTALAHQLVGVTGSVHSFEPTPRNFDVLTRNANHENIFLNQKALWDKNEAIRFQDFGKKLDVSNTILNDKERVDYYDVLFTENKEHKSIQVEAITLDSYCKKLNIKPTFVKLDCEGVEYEILLGSRETLKHKPILAIELLRHSGESGIRSKLVKFLGEYSYKGYSIRDDFSLAPLDKDKDTDVINAIFLPNNVS